ncbi:hypothetical protein V8F20_003712 [Naviculisporaceae sp. PSN 640]
MATYHGSDMPATCSLALSPPSSNPEREKEKLKQKKKRKSQSIAEFIRPTSDVSPDNGLHGERRTLDLDLAKSRSGSKDRGWVDDSSILRQSLARSWGFTVGTHGVQARFPDQVESFARRGPLPQKGFHEDKNKHKVRNRDVYQKLTFPSSPPFPLLLSSTSWPPRPCLPPQRSRSPFTVFHTRTPYVPKFIDANPILSHEEQTRDTEISHPHNPAPRQEGRERG